MRILANKRALLATAATAALLVAAAAGPASAELTPPGHGVNTGLTAAQNAEVAHWFGGTWQSLADMTAPTGLVADNLCQTPTSGTWTRSGYTSPTDIGAYLWSTVAAAQLGQISRGEANQRIRTTLTTLAGLQRSHGFWLNWYDPATGAVLTTWPTDGSAVRPVLSTVDNAWLAVGLHVVQNTMPQFSAQTTQLLSGMDFSFFYDKFDPANPNVHPGQMYGGFYADDNTYTGFHYGTLNTEPRMASYLGIAQGTVPTDHYWRMYRTLPADWTWQKQIPTGPTVDYDGVQVFEGSYNYRGTQLVPTWGGSMFEALMVPLFVPEAPWAPNSWGKNHPAYVQAQIDHGLLDTDYGVWGFSPSNKPEGGYQAYGVAQIGMAADGYPSDEDNVYWTRTNPPTPAQYTNGVVTPHASFLAMPFAPRQAVTNLETIAARYPGAVGRYGFQDSVNVQTGTVSRCVLSLDQGMIAAATADVLGGGLMQHDFADPAFAAAIRPLIGKETFNDTP